MRVYGKGLIWLAIATAPASGSLAAGFAINEHSAAQLGVANAGAAAAGEDPSTIVDNPAGLIRLDRPQFAVSGTLAGPSLAFSNGGSTLATGAPTPGPNANGGSPVPLPNLFASMPVNRDLAIGLGIFPSFGLATEYPQGWVGRYQALTTDLTSIDFAPTVAFRLAPTLSVGITPVARYTDIKYSNAIDFGTIGAASGIPGAIPATGDGTSTIKASDWSFGFNGGLLFEPTETTRIGLAYFYNNAAHLAGTADFSRSAIGDIIAGATGAFINTGASAVIDYPNHFNFGVIQQLSSDADIRFGFTWTEWSSFNKVVISFNNPNQFASVTNENWRDTYALALGGTYYPTENWVVRAGISYDQTPVRDRTFRTPRLPDATRITPSVGVGYNIADFTTLDFAYQHMFGGSVGLDVSSATGDTLLGKTALSADIVALQLTVRY